MVNPTGWTPASINSTEYGDRYKGSVRLDSDLVTLASTVVNLRGQDTSSVDFPTSTKYTSASITSTGWTQA